MRALRRFVLNVTGWRRRYLARLRRYRKWCELCRTEGDLLEMLSLERCAIARAYLQWELNRHQMDMMIFREGNK